MMQKGSQLVKKVPGRAGWELRLVVQGGLRILDKIDALDYATLQRPAHAVGAGTRPSCCGEPCGCDNRCQGPHTDQRGGPRTQPRLFMTPEDYVQQKAAASGSSFYYAFLFLPTARRAAITAFYAFCREVDDVVDEVTDPGVAATKLAWWQSEVAKAFAGQPSHPVMQALMPHCPTYGIEQRHLQAVIEGCQMDLEQTRYLDYPALQRYCHLVAGVVGEVAAQIFGQTEPAHHRLRAQAGPGASSSPTSSATWARTRCAGASTCRSASCSSST